MPGSGPVADAPGDAPENDAPPSDGPPPVNGSGCADGEREGFLDPDEFPTIAGCQASWSGLKDLRADNTGSACGDDLGSCDEPADACEAGWSICGLEGAPSQISEQVDGEQCAAAGGGSGAFVAAMSHCTLFADPVCEYDEPYPCTPSGDCSEPVCCGPECTTDVGCKDGVYPGTTAAGGANAAGCGSLDASTQTGILCCKD